jgi:hypothetical protein
MADPVTASVMAGIGIASSVLGGITGAAGSVESGNANATMYQYKAGVAAINQQINKQNANWATQTGEISAEEKGLKAGQDIAETKVVQAASGFDVNTGTGSSVRDSQTSVAEFDQGIIRWDAAKTAYGYETKAATDEAEGQVDLQAAGQAQTAGWIGAASSILGGVSGVASKWSQASQIGIGSSSGQIGTFNPSNYGAAPTWI